MQGEAKPTIAVLGGTGKEGGGLALRWAHRGYPVIVGSRTAERAAEAAAAMNETLGGAAVTGAANADAAAKADIVVLAVPYAAQQSTVQEVRTQLEGKILIDVTVPLVPPKVSRVQLPEGGSAVEAVQKLLGEGVKVVSAFQNISAHHLTKLDEEIECDVLVCADDPETADTVVALAEAIGLKAWNAGPLANSVVAEGLTSVLIALNRKYKVPGSGIRITGI
ncbi:NADPH-dependent F420 reductase [Sphingosinicella microcystinivorans]|uniref:NADPH-dependent F420 reductase n=1 Tax=Sphingosinicella microcystinivorans TaxID=335406 RepID=UPI0022F396AF|nr:NADPH-dependent F420 reductase [Sphingosinicella microcystinivorans]WBX82801.1 NADPH-dependent F420 reductase [Sphingosinicella microcystinivorans]